MAQETWSIREVQDQVRNLLTQTHAWITRNVEPFEKLPEALDAAARILEQDLPAAKQEVEGLTRFIQELRAEVPILEAQAAAARTRTATLVQQAQDAQRDAERTIVSAMARAKDEQEALASFAEQERLRREREAAEHRAQLHAELDTLAAQKTRMEAEIEALRKKFASF